MAYFGLVINSNIVLNKNIINGMPRYKYYISGDL